MKTCQTCRSVQKISLTAIVLKLEGQCKKDSCAKKTYKILFSVVSHLFSPEL